MRIGVIGLGNIGGAVAANLVADGHEVRVYDRDAGRVEALGREGATACASPGEVARAGEVTFLSLPTPRIVREVAAEWVAEAPAGSVLVDLSTNAPASVRALGAELSAAGCHLLEAPLTGGAPGARARQLVFLVGGDDGVFERCRPLLEKLGRAVFHLGGLGRGNTAKLANSLLAFASTWASLEALALAARAGIDLRTLVEAVRTAGASNFYMDRMVEGLGRRGRAPNFALELAAKDAGLIRELAEQEGIPAPLAAGLAGVFEQAVAAGLGGRDWSELDLFMEQRTGLRLELAPK